LAEFTEQTNGYPQGDLFGEAMFMKAESLFRTEDYEKALPAYEKAQQVLADSPKATEAVKVLMMLHGGQAAAQLKQWEKSLAMLTPITTEYPESAYAPEAIYEQGWANQNLGNNDEALKLYQQAAGANRGKVGARARFMAGEMLFLKKDFDNAVKEFQRVMFGYGGDEALDEVKPWQAKAGSEAGRVTEVGIAAAQGQEKKALISKAKQFYQYVVEKHPQSEVTPLAKKRLEELSKL
jgi:TolA-binding protein